MSLKHRLQAYGELGNRYWKTFAFFWKERDHMNSQLLHEDEAQFLPAALAIQEAPPSKTWRVLAWILMGMVLVAVLWAVLGKTDIIVNAQGRVIPSERSKTIASVDTARVVSLHIKEGQQVKAGDVLMQLDTSVLEAERDKALGDRDSAVISLVRNQALLDAIQQQRSPTMPERSTVNAQYQVDIAPEKWQEAFLHVQGQYQDYAARFKKLSDDVAHYRQALPLATQQASSYRALAATKDVSRDAWQDKERARIGLQAQLQEASNQRATLSAETRKLALDQMAEARRIAQANAQDALRADSAGKRLTLTAPVTGTVQQLSVHTVGGVVPAAQPLMQIVPTEGPMEIEAFIENKDKGFVHAGQKANLKVDTFEYTKYGTLPGQVVHVSEDAIQDEKRGLIYAVKILLDRSTLQIDGKDTPVTPGMAVNVEVLTGNRRVIEYVLSPLMRHGREAMKER